MAKISPGRLIVSALLTVCFVGMILLGEFIDRMIPAIFFYVIIAICVLETRKALGSRIPDQFSWLVWTYALFFGLPYFWFGYVGVIIFTLVIFIIGCLTAIVTNQPDGVLQNFAFMLVYPAMLLSTLLYINKSASTITILPDNPVYPLLAKSLWGEQLLPYNTLGLGLVFTVSCFTDMFALLFGVLFGKRKLAPLVSPKKTVEGAIGGLFGGLLGAALMFLLFEVLQLFASGLPLHIGLGGKIACYIAIGLIGSAFTQIGDLLASLIKRHCGKKDYGKSLGEHGGFMDRFDGIMLNSVFVAVVWAFML